MKTNNQRGRIEIIDFELSRKDYVKTSELVQAIEDKLDIKFDPRTIQKDIELMQRSSPIGYDAPIKKNNQKKAWYYEDPNFTIKAFGLSEDDVKALIFYTKALDQFKGHKFFEKVFTAIEKVLGNFKFAKKTKELIANRTILQTEVTPPIKGVNFIEDIVIAIAEKRIIEFEYKKFGEDKNIRRLKPYLVKEDKHLWYVIGILEKEKKIKSFALDRINSLRISYDSFDPIKFDHKEYYKNSFGITVLENQPILDVVLSFKPYTGNYIKALKIHDTQEEILDNDQEYRISVKVRPSYEFYSKILSYGDNVKVISPNSVVKEIKQSLQNAIDSYN